MITYFNPFCRTAPRVIFGLKGRNVFQSTNSNATTTNTMNRNNIFLTSFSGACTISNANQYTNMTFIIVRNPSTITYSSTSAPPPWKIVGNNGLYVFDGVAVTASTGVSFTGGEVILEFDTLDNDNVIADLKEKNIYFTPDDTYLVAFYTTLSGTNYNVQASLSWQLNL